MADGVTPTVSNWNYVDQVIQDYLSYLEDGAPEPSFDHLTPEDRALAEDLINSLNAGRGIDPYQSRPSLDALLRGSAASTRSRICELHPDLRAGRPGFIAPRCP